MKITVTGHERSTPKRFKGDEIKNRPGVYQYDIGNAMVVVTDSFHRFYCMGSPNVVDFRPAMDYLFESNHIWYEATQPLVVTFKN